MAAITLLGNVTEATDTGSNPSFSHTVAATTDLIVICISTDSWSSEDAITAIAWDSAGVDEAFTFHERYSGSSTTAVAEIWYLKNPTIKTATVSCTRTGTEGVAFVASNWEGADLDNGFEKSTQAGTSGTTSLISNPTASWGADDIFISVMALDDDEGATVRFSHTVVGQSEEGTTSSSVCYSTYLDTDWGSQGWENFDDGWSMLGFRLAASQSSSSSSSSASSSSSRSSSSSSSSAAIGTVVWGHHTAVTEDYDENIDTNWTEDDGWTAAGTPGNDNETIGTTLCTSETISEPWHIGAIESKIELNNYASGSGPASTIQYRTHATRAGVLSASWTAYNGTSFTSLGWAQIKLIHT